MSIVVDPTYVHDNMTLWVCGNYLIETNGPGERLHRFPEEIVELE